MSVDPPVFVNVIVAFEGAPPIASVPKSTDGGDAVIGVVDATPSPSSGRLTAPPLVLAVSVPVWSPSAAGVNVNGTVSCCPAFKVTGSAGVVAPLAKTGVCAEVAFCTLIPVTVIVAVAVNVADAIELPPRLVGGS